MNTMLDYVLGYANTGWPMFPLTRTKAPAFRSPHDDAGERSRCKGTCGQPGHGLYDATTDEEILAGWWGQRPHLLIAGRVPQHLMVLDVDPRGGGEDTLARLVDEHGPLPETLTCYSGRGDGGRHLYFTRPPIPLSGAKLRPGVDLIHHGLRYVILPPSPHPATGEPYWWGDVAQPIAHPPAWLVRLMMPKPKPAAALRPRTANDLLVGGAGEGLVRFVERLDSTPGTGRHDAVMWALSRAHEHGHDPDVVERIKNAARAVGKEEAELDRMITWAMGRYGGAA